MLSLFLAPFAWLYGAVVGFRNFLYDIGIKRSYHFDQAVVCVGNLSVGGTGKTPMIEYLVRLLSQDYKVAILSRGYERKTSGFLLATENENASTLGDEPFQFYTKFNGRVTVAVCENRAEGIKRLTELNPELNIILLDDAFQHRRVKPLTSILLTEFSKPFFNDNLLPQGRLRESKKGSKRADFIVVTKCKELTTEIRSQYNNSIKEHSGDKPVYFSEINYISPQPLNGNNNLKENVVLVTGIANSRPLEDYVSEKYTIKHHFHFPDHHDYLENDIGRIQQKALSVDASVLTTEKDAVKLRSLPIDKELWFYLPIETQFLENGSEFDRMLQEKIDSFLAKKKYR